MSPEKRKVIQHPHHMRNLQDVAQRWFSLRKEHERAVERAWRGLLSEFSDSDLTLLREMGFVSQHDEQAIAFLQRRSR